MAKSIKSIYFRSELLLSAEAQDIDVNAICNEALKIAVNRGHNQGTTEGAFGNFLQTQAEKAKDIEIVRKLSKNRDERFNAALKVFCSKYDLHLHEALKEIGL